MVTGSVTALFIGALLIANSACARNVELPVPHELIAFVEARTGVKLPEEQSIAVVDNDSPIFASAEAEHAGAEAAEAFGVIYIPERIAERFKEPKVQALVVHELTHVAQELRGNVNACAGQREAEAYKNQSLYLVGIGQFPVMSAAELQAMAQCEANY